MLATLLDARIPAAPVNDVGAILEDQHLQARGSLAPMLAAGGPALDADRDAVLRDWLG